MAASAGRPTSGTFLPTKSPAVQPLARMAAPVAAQISSPGSKASRIRSGRCSAMSRNPASRVGTLLAASAVTVDLPPAPDPWRQETTTENWTRPRRSTRTTAIAPSSQHGRLDDQVAFGEPGRAQRVQVEGAAVAQGDQLGHGPAGGRGVHHPVPAEAGAVDQGRDQRVAADDGGVVGGLRG